MIPGFFFCLSATRCPPFFVPAEKLFDFSGGFHAGAALRRLPGRSGSHLLQSARRPFRFQPARSRGHGSRYARIGRALTHWLAPVFGNALMLAVDSDKIEALSPDRAALWE